MTEIKPSEVRRLLGYERDPVVRINKAINRSNARWTNRMVLSTLRIRLRPIHFNELPKFIRHRAIAKGIDLS